MSDFRLGQLNFTSCERPTGTLVGLDRTQTKIGPIDSFAVVGDTHHLYLRAWVKGVLLWYVAELPAEKVPA